MKKMILLFFIFQCSVSFSDDGNVCSRLLNVVSTMQDRYDQAAVAYKDSEAICKDDDRPESCKAEIKKEYENSIRDLNTARGNYLAAGCENKTANVRFIVRNGKKVFGVQNFSAKNLYIINFGFEWAYFNPETDSGGYNFSKISGGGILSPSLPVGCFVADTLTVKTPISGFINGVEGGAGALQLALKGKCQPFIDRLSTEAFSIYFKDIQSMQAGDPVTPLLKLYIQDLPN